MTTNWIRVLLFAALAVPLLAFWPQGPDWSKDVELSANSPRYGLRLAAARKVAMAGAEAVPAIEAFAKKNGRNALPAALLEAIADQPTLDEVVWRQLVTLAKDHDFYWRAQAMRGLALRAPKLPAARDELRSLMTEHRNDAAWLMRVHARFGLALLGDDAMTTLPEADPRARTKLAALLLTNGKVPPLQPLVDALADERTFLGVPWAQANAKLAYDALKTWLGDTIPKLDGDDKRKSLAAVADATAKKSGQQLMVPTKLVTDAEPMLDSGFELLSCKHGDVFVRWNDEGVVFAGIDGQRTVRLATAAWQKLAEERQQLDLGGELGVVVCDTLRLCWTKPAVHVKVAPANLPPAATAWLQNLARAIEEAGDQGLANSLRSGLEQFAKR